MDLVSSLEESMRLEWNGDADLGDGRTQLLYAEYHKRIKSAEDLDLALGSMESTSECSPILLDIQRDVGDDLEFINACKKFGYLKVCLFSRGDVSCTCMWI